MDREAISGARRRNKSRKPVARAQGLKLVSRAGHWYAVGTARIEGRSVRIRTSTGFPDTPDFEGAAHDEMLSILANLRREIVHGIKPSKPTSTAAAAYLKRPRARGDVGAATVANIKLIVAKFGTRTLDSISEAEWGTLVETATAGRAASTRERLITTVLAFIKWCAAAPREWVRAIPAFDRDAAARSPNRRARRRVGDLRADLVSLMIDNAAIHLQAQIAVARDTGARVSSIIYDCTLADLILAPGREQITFHGTKNGETVTAALTAGTADIMRRYLKWRGKLQNREQPLFLTHRREPYEHNGKSFGGQTKTAFHAMRRRTVRALIERARLARAAGDKDAQRQALMDAQLVRQVTPHWFRHAMATRLLDRTGNPRLVMDQGGWLDIRSVMGYATTIEASRRDAIEAMATDKPVGTILTHAARTPLKKV